MRATEHEPPARGAGKPEPAPAQERGAPAFHEAETRDAVTQASEDSFPASDAPPWTSSVTRGAPEHDTAIRDNAITEASEQSFPASDAPSWTSSAM